MTTLDLLRCATCGTAAPHERPPCPDGHGRDCPEVACTRCGAATLTAPWPLPVPVRLVRPRRPLAAAGRAA